MAIFGDDTDYPNPPTDRTNGATDAQIKGACLFTLSENASVTKITMYTKCLVGLGLGKNGARIPQYRPRNWSPASPEE